jgi:hypothetical protein
MGLDVSDAIELAQDLIRTSDDYYPHDPDLAAQFEARAHEICDDLGIDRSVLQKAGRDEKPSTEPSPEPAIDPTPSPAAVSPSTIDIESETASSNRQLRYILDKQAKALDHVEPPRPRRPQTKRSFRLFGGPGPAFQSA